MSDTVQDVFTREQVFRRDLWVEKDGFYNVVFQYHHDNWDTWMKLEIRGEEGQTVRYIPPLPRKDRETTVLLYLFRGTNRLTAAPRYDQPTDITGAYIAAEAPVPEPTLTPSRDRFYRSDPRDRRLTVVSYTGAPERVTCAGVEIPFVPLEKETYTDPDAAEELEPFYYYHILLPAHALMDLAEGSHALTVQLPEGKRLCYALEVLREPEECALQIVSLDVNHGNAVLLRLPNGKNMLIDTGTRRCAREVIFPYLRSHGITLDYCLITHFHEDHMGCLEEVLRHCPLAVPDDGEAYIGASARERAAYLSAFSYLDCRMLRRYDRLDTIWDLGGVTVTALNSHYDENGIALEPEGHYGNDSSVSLLVSYKGFRYYHGSDNHAPTQRKNLADFAARGGPEALRCQYMQANHHFHGDLEPEMIRTIDPVAVYVPANAAIYSRSAFMVDYMQRVVGAEYPGKRLKETFVSYFSGTVTVWVNSGDDWHYETL